MRLKIRRVEIPDLEDILEISRHVWEGHDYLPKVIKKWLDDPNSFTFGTEVNGHLVGLDNLRLVEGGRTGWMEGLRVHPDYRGQGLAKKLTEYLVKEAQHLNVQRLRFTTASDNLVSLRLGEKVGFERLLKMGVFWHPDPNIIPSPKNYPPIKKASSEEIYELVTNHPQIIPQSVLVYDWKALDSTHDGFETVGESNEFYVALRKGRIDSFSLGGNRYESEGSTWSFTIYAAKTDGFQSQLSHQIALAQRCAHSAIMCTYETKFEKTLNDIDWLSKEHWGLHIVLLEKPMF